MRWPQEERCSWQHKTEPFSLKLWYTPRRTPHCHETDTSACACLERSQVDPTCYFLWSTLGQCLRYKDQVLAGWSPLSKTQTSTDIPGRQRESRRCLMRMRFWWKWAERRRRARCCKRWRSYSNCPGLRHQSLLQCQLWNNSVKRNPLLSEGSVHPGGGLPYKKWTGMFMVNFRG